MAELIFLPPIIKSITNNTPCFIFSKQKIVDKYNEFKGCFPNADIHYAIKANSEIEVLKVFKEIGCGFEIASACELDILKGINVSSDKVIYGTSVKPIDHIHSCNRNGCNRFAFDSVSELEKIALVAPSAKVYARLSVNDSNSVFQFSEKFGTGISNAIPLLNQAKLKGLQPYGISFHVGSQCTDQFAWGNALKSLIEPLTRLKQEGIAIETINIGGGFPCKYDSSTIDFSLKEIATNAYRAFNELPYQPKLILEPGRGLIAEAGILVTSVIAKIVRNDSTWLFLDAGVYNGLFETMAYQGSTKYAVTALDNNSGEQIPFALAGPTGDSPDVILRNVLLPKDTDVGDRLIIHNVGAYSLSVTSNFNGFPKPQVHLI